MRPRRPSLVAHVVVVAAACASMATRASALGTGPSVLDLDVGRTTVTFTLAGSLHTTEGVVPLTSGRLEIDPDTGDATGLVVADARATTTGNRLRDETMRNDVLESDHYPDIRFRPTGVGDRAVSDDGSFSATVRGVLALHGREHEMAVAVRGQVVGDEVTARCRFTVPYVAWGLHDPSVLVLSVAKTVDVDIHAVGRVSRPAPPQ